MDDAVRALMKDAKAVRKHRSLFWEILKWVVVPLLLAMPLSLMITYWIGISLATDAFDRALASQTKALSEQVAWLSSENRYLMTSDLPTILPDDEIDTHLFRIDDANGRLLFGDTELDAAPREDIIEIGPAYFRDERLGDLKVRTAITARTFPGNDARIYIQVAESLDKRTELAREITRSVLLPQAILIPAIVLMLWLGLRRGLDPLNQLRQQLASRSANDLSPVDTSAVPHEVAPLVDAFNQTLARAAQNNEAQRRFIANAAHQLRTPLAGLKMQTELALQSHDREAMADALQRIAVGSTRSTYLVNQLLTLARAEAGAGLPIAMERFDVAALVRNTVEDMWDAARARVIDLGIEVPSSAVMMAGNAPLLREMLTNLVDNALKYSPRGARVTVRLQEVEKNGDGVLALEVEDHGFGIPPADRERVFERFYRSAETGHARADTDAGTGIGLAIVKEIVTRHGGSIVAETPPGGVGTLMRVSLPAR